MIPFPMFLLSTLFLALNLFQSASVEAFVGQPTSVHHCNNPKAKKSTPIIFQLLPIQHRHRQPIQSNLAPQQLGEFEAINLLDIAVDEDDVVDESMARTRRRVWLYDFVTTTPEYPNSRTIPYQEAWDFQKLLVENLLHRIGKKPKDPPLYAQFIPMDWEIKSTLDDDDDSDESQGGNYATNNNNDIMNNMPKSFQGCDSIVLLEHDPVYTLGTASDTSFIHGYDNESNNGEESSVPVVRIERGGEVTYHGPGQLVVYPILDLRGYKQDVHWYMRALEEVIMIALQKAGITEATREENLTGVWVSNKKIAALGIKTRRWVTMHGLAINIDFRSLQNFGGIVPCGLEGREVTCLNQEIITNAGGLSEMDEEVFRNGDSKGFTLEEFAAHVKEALEEIFGITLVSAI